MFFLVSKLLWIFVAPVNLALFGALVGVVAAPRFPRLGRALAVACVAALLLVGVAPLGALLLRPLEARFPPPPADLPAPYAIVTLGGAIDDEMSLAHGQVDLVDGASRLTETAILARRYPMARIVYTGGSASLTSTQSDEAEQAKRLLVDLGVDPVRIAIETKSRNTDENARFTAAMERPRPDQAWLLVTSAYHMPRAMGLFRKAGFAVRAFPVDYRTFGDARDLKPSHDPVASFKAFELAVHEWVGLIAYRAAGKIDAWFPGP